MKSVGIFDRFLNPRQQTGDQQTQPTIDSLLDALGGYDTGFFYDNPSSGRLRDMRNAALRMPAFSRCVHLISVMTAQLVSGGSLRVMDRDGNTVDSPQARRMLALLSESPDGMIDSHSWVMDAMCDYLIDGNAIIEIDRGEGRLVRQMRRLQAYDATTVKTTNGTLYYESQIADGDGNRLVVPSDRIAHCRWPRMVRQSQFSSTNRSMFALSTISLLHPALQIALAGDRFIQDWFRTGQTASVGISIPRALNEQQVEAYQKIFAAIRNTRTPLIVDQGATFTNLTNSAATADQEKLAAWQVEQIGRLFGVPAPILNQQLTSWGQGIESLVKIFWRMGLWQHVHCFLAPLSYRMLPAGQKFEVDETDIVRGDSQGTAQLLTALGMDAQHGETATTEERRRLAGLPTRPFYGELKDPPPPQSPAVGGDIDNGEAGG